MPRRPDRLARVTFDGRKVVDEERIALGARIRDVEQGPRGEIYVASDEEDGEIWQLTPAP